VSRARILGGSGEGGRSIEGVDRGEAKMGAVVGISRGQMNEVAVTWPVEGSPSLYKVRLHLELTVSRCCPAKTWGGGKTPGP